MMTNTDYARMLIYKWTNLYNQCIISYSEYTHAMELASVWCEFHGLHHAIKKFEKIITEAED